MIDLRSDTVTQPTEGMRRAMAEAPVGDDVYGDDPTVCLLERVTAEVLGKDAAVYMPTGSMTNQVAIRAHTEPGDRVLMDGASHVVRSEAGGPAALSGVTVHPIAGDRGLFDAEAVREAVGAIHRTSPATLTPPATLLCVENTHNGGGGTVWSLDALEAVGAEARGAGLATHLDGARLWNAAVASGVPESSLAAPFDSVSVCFSKGLGAPMGSVLAGTGAFVERARRFKQLFGGGFRQAGIVAAGALYALEHHRGCLSEDHEKAALLADALSAMPGVDLDRASVQTNILRFGVPWGLSGPLVERCLEGGVRILSSGAGHVRAVTHRDVSMSDVEQAIAVIGAAMRELDRDATRDARGGSNG